MRSTVSAFRILAWVAVAALALVGAGTAAYGVTADGDIGDIRAFSSPDAPPPIELDDPLGFTDEPILSDQIVNQPCSPNCVSPSGFNIGSVVMAYDPANDSYYIGMDVSPSPADDPTFSNGSGAWDGDGDGDPNVLTDGLTMNPTILYDNVPPLSGLTDKYTYSLDIGNDGLNDLLMRVEDVGYGPELTVVGQPCLTGSAGWSVGDYAGNGPDVELIVGNVSCLGMPECDYYTVRVTAFADTDADSAEEILELVFEFDVPLTLCKVDETGAGIAGWTFTVNGDPVTTDADGCVTVFLTPEGSWDICETLPWNQRVCGVTVDGNAVMPSEGPTGTWCISVDADCHDVTWCNEPCTGSITACKYNCDGDPLEGWLVTVLLEADGGGAGAKSAPIWQDYTGPEGCVTFPDLPVGTYMVCETMQPGWEPCPDYDDCYTVEISCDNPEADVEFRNQPCLGAITACKLDCDGDPILDPPFTITLTDDAGNVIAGDTGGDGCVTFSGLPVGTYVVCETMLPGWELCPAYSDCYTVEISCDQKEVSVEFRNQPCVGTIVACKQDCDGNPLEGWEITVLLADGAIASGAGPANKNAGLVGFTGPDGCVTFSGVPVGDYLVCETMLPGWELCPGYDDCYTVEISCDNPEADVLFRNQPCTGTISACKYECEGLPVASWEITVVGVTVTGIPIEETRITGPDGCITPLELPAGTYEVCEELPPGWELCDEILWPLCQTVEISCDTREVYVEFRNYPTVGPTRTPGYWFTHPDAMEMALDEDCGGYIAGGEFLLDCCMLDIYDANRVFWLGNRELDPNVRRTLGMHIIAAICNVCLLGSAPPDGFIEYGISVFCDPTATADEIGDAIEPLDVFNNSGTTLDVEFLEGLSADPNRAKGMARMGDLSCVPTL